MRNYRISHQTLCLNKIDFDNKWICGYTDIIIWPLDPSMVSIHLNSKQIRIHSTKLITLQSDVSIVMSDLAMSYHDPFMAVSRRADYSFFSLDNFLKLHNSAAKRVDLDEGIGELTLQIPSEFWPHISELKPLKLTVEFSLYRPKAGLYFVKPLKHSSTSNNSSNDDSGLHLFTTIVGNMSRLWFPCCDASEPCTWKLEITVNEELTAISNGVLLDTVYTPDLHSKVYHYYLKQPVPAFNIGLAVGDFEIYPDPNLKHVTHFCPPKLIPLLKTTVENIFPIFKFIEEKLNFNYPFDMYKTVFVDSAIQPYMSYASMTIFDVYLLHPSNILEQIIDTIKVFSEAIPEQFFGQYTFMKSWSDIWVPWGISGYLARLYIKKLMGLQEYRFVYHQEMNQVVNYEETYGGIVLDPNACSHPPNYSFSLYFAQSSNAAYMRMYKIKAALIIRLLELKIGPTLILKVFRKLLLLGTMAQNSFLDPNSTVASPITDRTSLLLCSELLSYAVDLVSGLQINNFLSQWVNKPGHVRIQATYIFNRRRNVVELTIKQFYNRKKGCTEYVGPVEVASQEYEGYYRQTVRIDRPVNPNQSKVLVDLTLHTKVRKHRKRKVTLANGSEVDIDIPVTVTSNQDADIPYLWLVLDPDMLLFGRIELEQSTRASILMLRYEKDPLIQCRAICEISHSRDPTNIAMLKDLCLAGNSRKNTSSSTAGVLPNNSTSNLDSNGGVANKDIASATSNANTIFYKVRIAAAQGLRQLMNETHQTAQGGLRDVLTTLFMTMTRKPIIRSNDFSNLGKYQLQIAVIRQLALLQSSHGLCANDIPQLLHDILLYNDNSNNRFSDCYYRAELLRAMGDSVRMGVFHRTDSSLEFMPNEVRSVLKDVLRCLTLDQAMPSYKFVLTQPCLIILRRLQEFGYIIDEPGIFFPYVSENNCPDVRSIALQCLISSLDGLKHQTVLEWLLNNVLLDDGFSTKLRLLTVEYLTDKIKFGGSITQGFSGLIGGSQSMANSGGTASGRPHDVYRMYWNQILPQLHRLIECQLASDWHLRSAAIQLVRTITELGGTGGGGEGHSSMDDTCGMHMGPPSAHSCDDDDVGGGDQDNGHNYGHQVHGNYLQQQPHKVINMVFGRNSPTTGNIHHTGGSNRRSNEMMRLSDDSDDDVL